MRKTIVGLLVADPEVAFKILALNTEKAHNVKEKSLETIRMARALAGRKAGSEADYAFEFEQAPYLTLGAAYEERRALSGGAYHPVLRRIDDFLDEPIAKALKERERRAAKVLKLDDAVSKVVAALKARGLTSPYLKPFVVARVNPIRFSKSTEFDFDDVMDRMMAAANKFNVERVKQEDVAKVGGGAPPKTNHDGHDGHDNKDSRSSCRRGLFHQQAPSSARPTSSCRLRQSADRTRRGCRGRGSSSPTR